MQKSESVNMKDEGVKENVLKWRCERKCIEVKSKKENGKRKVQKCEKGNFGGKERKYKYGIERVKVKVKLK